ncbi:MAG: flagellar M-ring protein FliF [Deltaproteobacteria bacterium]|nr:flagellar M-ring protein FliF [Deltaproteobacteria bacterium]
MLEFLRRVSHLFKDFFQGLNPARRTALVITALVVVTSVSALFFWAGSSDYQVLGTNLAAEDATSIMRLLREKKIPFKVDHDGKTIKIPPDAVYDLRLELATMGLPQTGIVGYEVFDKQTFGTTSFVQKINEKRAREGELMRTINNIKGVKRSRVHLALPTQSTFVEDQKKPTASVMIDIEPGVQLSDKQLTGISHLITSSVEGMEIGDVTIVDGGGKLLSKNSNDPLARQTATMLEYQQKQEGETEKKIQDILTRVVGEGKVVAKVALDLDFTQSSETQTQYDAEGAAVKSQQKESQVMDGSRPVPQGPPGAVSNTPGPAPASVMPEVRSNTQKVFETINNAVPEKVTRSSRAPGSIKRMSVAVLLDGIYQKDPAKPDAPAVFQKWSDEKLAEFKAIVTNAVALDPKRGDTIDVKNMEFRHEDMENADAQIAAFERKKMIANIIQYSLIGLVIAFFFFFVVRPFIKWLTDNTVESMESFLPKTIEELEKIQVQDENIGVLEEAIPVIVDKVDPEKVEGEMIKENVITLVENNPQKAAMILHEWVQQPSKAQKQEKNAHAGKRTAG